MPVCQGIFKNGPVADKKIMGRKEAKLLATKHTWEGGMRFPLRRSSSTVPKLKMTLSGVTLPEKKRNCHKKMLVWCQS